MKKLRLQRTTFAGGEVLTREQLKNIMGGYADATTLNSKTQACVGKKEGDHCTFTYEGSPESGYCHSFMFGTIHCSNLS